MARIRSIKPDFFLDDILAGLGPEYQVLFAGLWTQADREGRLADRPARIKAAILPYFDGDADAMLGNLQATGFIVRYSIAGERFISIPGFLRHQCPNVKEPKSIIPPPPKDQQSMVQTPCQHHASTILAPHVLEGKGREGKGKEDRKDSCGKPAKEKPAPHADWRKDERFVAFHDLYPSNRRNPSDSYKKWPKPMTDELYGQIMDGLRRWLESDQWRKDGGEFIPLDTTWLNKKRWEMVPSKRADNLPKPKDDRGYDEGVTRFNLDEL